MQKAYGSNLGLQTAYHNFFEVNLKPSGTVRYSSLNVGQNPLPFVDFFYFGGGGGGFFLFYTSFPFFVPLSVVLHLPPPPPLPQIFPPSLPKHQKTKKKREKPTGVREKLKTKAGGRGFV